MLQRIGQWLQKNPEKIPLGIGVFCLLLAAALLVDPVRLVMLGASAEGVVTEVVERVGRDSEGEDRLEYTATIRFKAGERNFAVTRSWHKSRSGYSRCFAGCYEKGERLKMRYLPDDPEVARVGSLWGLFGSSFTVSLVGAFALFFWTLWRSERRAGASPV